MNFIPQLPNITIAFLSFRGKWFRHLLVFLIYIVVSIFFTFPLILNLTDFLSGWEGDGYSYIWNVYAFWNRVFEFQNPFFTREIFYPIGGNLVFHTYGVLPSIFGIFFLDNMVLYINILVILTLAVSAYSCFNLVAYLNKDFAFALIAGLVYGFSPIMMSFVISQHYYFVMAAPFLPLGLLMLFKFFDTSETRYLAFLVMFFWGCFFTNYYTTVLYILMIAVVAIILVLNLCISKRDYIFQFINKEKLISCCCLAFIGLVLPSILFFISFFPIEGIGTKAFDGDNWYPKICSANVAGFFIPSAYNPLLNKICTFIHSSFGLDLKCGVRPYHNFYDTPSYFSGWGILLVAIVSFVRNFKNKYVFSSVIFGIVVLLYSLGPTILFAHTEIASGRSTVFYWVSRLPFLQLIDCPLRFPIGPQLSIAILVGMLLYRMRIDRLYIKVFVIVGLLLLFYSEYLTRNIELSNANVPAVYKILAENNDDCTILEIPTGLGDSKHGFGNDYSIRALNSKQMFWQTVHRKPRVGGYVSRVHSSTFEFFKKEPIVSDLLAMANLHGKWSNKNYSEEEILRFLSEFNLGYIVLSPNARQNYFGSVIEKFFSKQIEGKQEVGGFVLHQLKTDC